MFKIITLLAALLVVGCATTPTQPTPTSRVDLDPMLVRPEHDGKPGEAIDVNEIFERAYTAFTARRFEEAAQDYRTVVKYFPESRFFLPSAFNAGLSFEKLERWADAAEMYALIIAKDPGAKDAKDAYYRRANALAELGEWKAIEEMMTQVLLRNDLNNFDRVEAHVRRANALAENGDLQQAANGFETALNLNERAAPNEKLASDSRFIVQSYFGLGRVFHRQVNTVKLVLPPDRMTVDLQKKADVFLRSQYNYIKALSYHHHKYSMAAGYMIGRLYQDFYHDIFTAEIPDDLSDEAIALYFDELRKQIRPLMVRAVQVYKKNLSLSKRIKQSSVNNEWVADTEVQLARMQAYLDDEATQRRAERFARRGFDLEQMWAPVPVASDVVDVALKRATPRAPVEQPVAPVEDTP